VVPAYANTLLTNTLPVRGRKVGRSILLGQRVQYQLLLLETMFLELEEMGVSRLHVALRPMCMGV
jgi:hypothetical protein